MGEEFFFLAGFRISMQAGCLHLTLSLLALATASASARGSAPQFHFVAEDPFPRIAQRAPHLASDMDAALERATFAGRIATQSRDLLPGEPAGIVSLPPAPNSSVLVLFALGGLGCWQLGNSARKWNWHAAPDWFSTSGPQQIGHATVLDLSFTWLPVYPTGEVRVSFPRSRWAVVVIDHEPSPTTRASLKALAPRGPPMMHNA